MQHHERAPSFRDRYFVQRLLSCFARSCGARSILDCDVARKDQLLQIASRPGRFLEDEQVRSVLRAKRAALDIFAHLFDTAYQFHHSFPTGLGPGKVRTLSTERMQEELDEEEALAAAGKGGTEISSHAREAKLRARGSHRP